MSEGIPVDALASILGVKPSRYYSWRDAKLFEAAPSGEGVTQRFAMEAAVIHLLATLLGLRFGRIAYRQVRAEFLRTIPQGRFEIVWNARDRIATLTRTDKELGRAVRCGTAVLVIQPTAEIDRVIRAWQTEIDDRSQNLGAVKRRRKSAAASA
jgi:hypothetical protein